MMEAVGLLLLVYVMTVQFHKLTAQSTIPSSLKYEMVAVEKSSFIDTRTTNLISQG